MSLTFSPNSASIGATEYSLPRNANYAAGSTQATQAQLHPWINFANSIAGDEWRIRLYETVNGQYQLVDSWAAYGVVSKQWQVQMGIVGEGWDVTVQQITGSARVLNWSLRRNDETNANVVSIANNVVTAASLAVDATAAIAAAVMAFSHNAGRTVKGVIKRMDQLLTGQHRGMLGALWQLYDVDNATELVRAVQDTVAGTREKATIVAGD